MRGSQPGFPSADRRWGYSHEAGNLALREVGRLPDGLGLPRVDEPSDASKALRLIDVIDCECCHTPTLTGSDSPIPTSIHPEFGS